MRFKHPEMFENMVVKREISLTTLIENPDKIESDNCNFCPKTFSSSDYLTQHMKIKHKDKIPSDATDETEENQEYEEMVETNKTEGNEENGKLKDNEENEETWVFEEIGENGKKY